jgi:hypothetical protein
LHLARLLDFQARCPKKLEKSRFFAVRGGTARYALERFFSNSGSSAHSGRAGSSPASRTTNKTRNRKISGLILHFEPRASPRRQPEASNTWVNADTAHFARVNKIAGLSANEY